MSKLLKIRDWVLLFSAFTRDSLQEFKYLGDLIPNLVEARYGFFPPAYKKQSYKSAISNLLRAGEIERKLELDGKVYLQLTLKGKEKVHRKFDILSPKKWDGEFMLVIFDVPESEKKVRDRIRKKFRDLGFGMLQESVWITPYHYEEDLDDYLKREGYGEYVFVLKAKKISGKDLKDEAVKIWNLEKINSNYVEICSLLPKVVSSKLSEKDIQKAWKLYFETIMTDPLLPKELLPDNWARQKAYEMLKSFSASTKDKRPR